MLQILLRKAYKLMLQILKKKKQIDVTNHKKVIQALFN